MEIVDQGMRLSSALVQVSAIIFIAGGIFLIIKINQLRTAMLLLKEELLRLPQETQDEKVAQENRERGQAYEGLNSQLKDISAKGMSLLRNVSIVFIASLIFLFLIPYIPEVPIILINLVIVGTTILTFIDLSMIVIRGIENAQG